MWKHSHFFKHYTYAYKLLYNNTVEKAKRKETRPSKKENDCIVFIIILSFRRSF